MAKRHLPKVVRNNESKPNVYIGKRWVKNVLLVDIRKAGLIPSELEVNSDLKVQRMGLEKYREKSAVCLQNADESIEEYVPLNRLGRCFVTGCSYNTKSFVKLMHHVLCSHKRVKKFSCPFCCHTGSLSGMVEHLNMHGPTMFQCKYCSHYNFSHLKVIQHIKSKHIGRPSVVVELRDYKSEDDLVPFADEEVDVTECVDVEPPSFKPDSAELKTQGEVKVSDNGDIGLTDAKKFPRYSNNVSCSNFRDLRIFSTPSNGLKVNKLNQLGIELNPATDVPIIVDRDGSVNNGNGLMSSEIEDGKSMKTSSKVTNLSSQTFGLSFESAMKLLPSHAELRSSAYYCKSSEKNTCENTLMAHWQCGLCDYISLYNCMVLHAQVAHGIKYQFQCLRCSIFIASQSYIESHCLIFHPKILVTLTANYYLPGSSLPYCGVSVELPDGQQIFSPKNPIFCHKIPKIFHKDGDD